MAVLDKEDAVARHQTGRNSGVVHSGIYYPPGSAKAALVADGRRLLRRMCTDRAIPYDVVGKVIVAHATSDLAPLAALERRGAANGVRVSRLSPTGLRAIEPNVRGLAALSVPDAAITDFGAVSRSLADDVSEGGGAVLVDSDVVSIEARHDRVTVTTASGSRLRSRWLVNCAGLQSDRVARLAGAAIDLRIVGFRGDYHQLRPEARPMVHGLVYPVADPRWPFLGVHLTPMVGGGVHVGPTAVLALGREAYDRRPVWRDVRDLATDAAMWRLAGRYWRTGAAELARARSTRLLLRAAHRLVPDLTLDDLEPAEPGIRAQALGPDGRLVDDFAFAESPRCVHVLNAPSPAATASLAIGESIADRLDRLVARSR